MMHYGFCRKHADQTGEGGCPECAMDHQQNEIITLRAKLQAAEEQISNLTIQRDSSLHDSQCLIARSEAAEVRIIDLERVSEQHFTTVKQMTSKLQAAEELIGMLNEIADDYAQHDSWRCGYYDECHCGLNELQKLAGMKLSPCGYNKQEGKP